LGFLNFEVRELQTIDAANGMSGNQETCKLVETDDCTVWSKTGGIKCHKIWFVSMQDFINLIIYS